MDAAPQAAERRLADGLRERGMCVDGRGDVRKREPRVDGQGELVHEFGHVRAHQTGAENAAAKGYLIDVWQGDKGLPQNTVTGLAQTSDLVLRDSGLWKSLPIDIYADAGVRIDTDIGVFELTISNALGRVR